MKLKDLGWQNWITFDPTVWHKNKLVFGSNVAWMHIIHFWIDTNIFTAIKCLKRRVESLVISSWKTHSGQENYSNKKSPAFW